MEANDFVISKDENGQYMSGGYVIKSEYLKEFMSPLYQTAGSSDSGGNKRNLETNVSSLFPQMVIPMGLFVQPGGQRHIAQTSPLSATEHGQIVDDSLADKLHHLATHLPPTHLPSATPTHLPSTSQQKYKTKKRNIQFHRKTKKHL